MPRPARRILLITGTLHTDGQGLYTLVAAPVQVEVRLGEFGGDGIYVLVPEWPTNDRGIIYTDKTFQTELVALLRAAGIQHADDLGYSENGLQGHNYVHFDIGLQLYRELKSKGVPVYVDYEIEHPVAQEQPMPDPDVDEEEDLDLDDDEEEDEEDADEEDIEEEEDIDVGPDDPEDELDDDDDDELEDEEEDEEDED